MATKKKKTVVDKPKARSKTTSRGTDIMRQGKEQQVLATRVKEAALKSGMTWAEWKPLRKQIVGALRTKGTTKKSTATLKRASKLIKKSEGSKAAKAYSTRTSKVDKRGGGKLVRKPGGKPGPKKPMTASSGASVRTKVTKKKKKGY